MTANSKVAYKRELSRYPVASIADSRRLLKRVYTTSQVGGANNAGTIFQITPSGALTVLYNFDGTHGSIPFGGLTLGTDGNFYGTTEGGGAASDGVIFKFTPPSTLTVLYQFTGGADGALPYAAPIKGVDGNLYGTAAEGGRLHKGSVYKLTPAGKFITLHSFNGKDGSNPVAPLVQGTDGNLYGTTEFGGTGAGGSGTIFKITTAGKLTTLYNFDITHGQDVQAPLIQCTDGNFYGTTSSGGDHSSGVVFSITPAGSLTVLHSRVRGHLLATCTQVFLRRSEPIWLRNARYGTSLWIADYGNAALLKMRTSDGTILASYPVGANPRGVAFDGANLWIASGGNDTVTKLRASDGTNLGTVSVGNFPYPVVFDGAFVWIGIAMVGRP